MVSKIDFVRFPAVENATEDGVLAMGGSLDVNTLVSAYAQGIFPWYNHDQPILWWSPDPRMVLFPDDVKISRSLSKTLRNGNFKLSCNQNFEAVIQACALRGGRNQNAEAEETWITKEMNLAYNELHRRNYAHSIEVWQDNELVGGLYGIVLGKAFFGESMFSRVNDASKVALVSLCQFLSEAQFKIIDCQVASDHLFSLGAVEIKRTDFLEYIEDCDVNQPNINFSKSFAQAHQDNVITTP